MNRRMVFPVLLGLAGVLVLGGLGTWQLQRMHWKADVIAGIEARIRDAPVALPAAPAEMADRYLPVVLSGQFTGTETLVMAGQRGVGAGFHLVTVFETAEGRRVLVDRGFIPETARGQERPATEAEILGNLHWPQDTDRFTPPPDQGRNLWFARDVAAMAAALGTEPVMVILRSTDEPAPPARPVPLDSSGIPDNHLEYAITWFSLAAVWLGMTAFLLWRIRQRRA